MEGLELKEKQNTGIKNLHSAIARKTKELIKIREEKEVMSEVIISLRKDLKRANTIPKAKKMVEVGIQAVPEVVSASIETDPQVKEK